ncbi:methyltransferase domain-containing protein [Stenotrophomonas acidaminiphila]
MNRKAHAVIDLPSRQLKAKKIERLLGLSPGDAPLEVLEIGCGSGGISHYFATHKELSCRVTAVDVNDSRQVHEGYTYLHVEGVDLPFAAERFDVVISNHVIEHVGDTAAQLQHLEEIHRVLKQDGVAYLAVPNRWMVTEPHYRLKFLSWLPRRWRSPYLRLRGRGSFYDCEPPQLHELENMMDQTGMRYRNLCIEGWRETFDIERPHHWATRLLRRTPDAVLRPLVPLVPTLIYRLERSSA